MGAPKQSDQPPKLAIRFLNAFCKERLFEEIEGDLYECFQLYLQKHPKWKANVYYWFQLLSFFRRYALKGKSQNSKYLVMLKSHLKFSWRYMKKHPTGAFLNVLSLSIGIACFLFIFIYLKGEFSYDSYHKDSDRIYRVVIDMVNNGERIPDATTPPALAPALKSNLPEVELATRIFPTWGAKYLMGVSHDRKFYEADVFRVDPNFFEIFTFDVIQGDIKTMLDDPSNIVLTRSMAEKYFGPEDPMGKEIIFFSMDGQKKVVTGVIEDVPFNSHFHFDFLRPLHFEDRNIDEMWGWYNYYTYVKLKRESEYSDFESKLQPLYLSNNPRDTINANITYAQRLEDIHLNSALKWELDANNNMSNIRMFISIGLFILIISLINYLNLTIGNISKRTKEAGVRRSFGAVRRHLVGQFIVESIAIIIISILMGALFSQVALHFMEPLFGRAISIFDPENLETLALLGVVALVVGIIAGSYPAFYFSNLGEIKSIIAHKKENFFDLKRVLLIAQFTISSVMIVGTMVVYKQLNFYKNAHMGVNTDQVLIVENAGSISDQQVLMDKINQLPFVESAGLSSGVVGGLNWTFTVGYPDQFLMNYSVAHPEYMNALEFEFIAGRNFDESISSDAQGWNLIVNETALEALDLTMDQVGESVVVSSQEDSLIYGRILGVVKDFHFTNFKSEIKPYCFFYRDTPSENLAVRMSSANIKQNLESLELVWNDLAVGVPFESYFLDQSFASLHKTEERLSNVMFSLTALSIFIAFIGMLAIVNLAVKGRLKEVAVRKVLGATTNQVVNLFTKKFMLLVIISNLVGLPIAGYIMKQWLADFAYRVTLDPWLFILAFISTVGIAYIIVASRSYKAANADLTERLNDE